MDFEVTDILAFPRDQVFEAFRDRMEELPNYLANIAKITLLSREERKGQEVHQVALWEAKVTLPGPLEKLAPESARKWKDIATWRTSSYSVEWRVEPPIFTEAVDVHGVNTFVPEGDRTKMTIRGALNINASKLKGVPTLLARQLIPPLERFVVSTIKKNFIEGNRGIERYLAAQKPKKKK
jgi:hypothetical protein